MEGVKQMGHSIGVISMGCNKNRVDTEHLLAELEKGGHDITNKPEAADIILVNTCGFIDDAKMESIEAVMEAAGYKKTGSAKKVIVSGCLSERYRQQLADELTEADGFIGVGQYGRINEIIERIMGGERVMDFEESVYPRDGRILTTPKHLAYVRIAEGCNNRCSYCIIPVIRGRYVSRPIEEIYDECLQLVDNGAKELVVIAQDTTFYGKDIYGEYALPRLLRKLAKTGADWIRLLYSYPEHMSLELLETMADEDRILNYLDIPLQHVDDDILKSMGRPCSEVSIHMLMDQIKAIGDFTVRTTFIAGYPGETRQQHEKLLKFVGEGHFDRMGAFAYSQEENTRAAKMEGQLDEEIKQERREALMRVQRGISFKKNRSKVGNVCDVLVEGYNDDEKIHFGRSKADAPETDGLVYINGCPEGSIGEFRKCMVTYAAEYDLLGEYVDDTGK